MVDFGNTQFEGSIQAGVQRQAPVVDQSGLVLASALEGPAKTLGAMAGSIFKANQEKEGDAVLNGFRSKLLSLADAAEQNNWSIGEIGVRQRQIYAEALSNAPGYGDDLNDIYTSLTGGRVAGVLAGASEYSQAQTKLMTDAVSNGWVVDESNPGQGIQNYMANQAAVNQLALATNTRNVGEYERSVAITDGLRKVASTGMPWVQNKVDVALQQIAEGADPAEVYAQLQSDYASQKAAIQDYAQEADSEWVLNPMDAIIEDFGKVVNGEYTAEAYNANIANQIAKGKAAWMADPEIGQILIAQEVLGENFPTLMQTMLPKAQAKLAAFLTESTPENRTSPPDIFDLSEGTQQNIDLLKSELAAVNSGGVDEAGIKQTNTKMNNFFRAFKNFSGAVENPQELRQAIEFMASDEFNTWAVANGGVPAEMRTSVENLITTQYGTPLMEAVTGRWEALELSIPGAGVTLDNPYGLTDTSAGNFIDVIWDGDGVRFVPKAGFEDNTIVRATVKGLNIGDNSVAQPLNTLIKAAASAEGSNDYKGIWEVDYKDRIFNPDAVEDKDQSQIVDEAVSSTSVNPDNISAVAKLTEDTSASALAAIEANFDLGEFNEELDLVKESVMAYANTNFNPVSALPPEGSSPADIIGALRGTGLPDATQVINNNTQIRFASGVDTRVDTAVLDKWSAVQSMFPKQLNIISGFRDPARNKAAGGASKSQHMHGNAIDIETGHLTKQERLNLIRLASEAGFTGIGVYNNNLHFDIGGRRAWGPDYHGTSIPAWAKGYVNEHLAKR